MNPLLSSVSPSPIPVDPFAKNFRQTGNKTTKVILVRHARTTYNDMGRYQGSSDASVLTPAGHEAAYQTGLALQEFNFDAIYTSPLTRVRQTTQKIVSALEQTSHNVPPILTNPYLTEIQMSDWQGLYYQEVKEKFPEAYQCWQNMPHFFTFDNWHFPVLKLFQQARKFWQEILNKHRGQTILIVAHSGTNRALISTAIGLSSEHYHSLQQSNCGISSLEFKNCDRAELKFLNITQHLDESLPKLKAGKTGWRWLLLSDDLSSDISNSDYLRDSISINNIDLILTDNSHKSESIVTSYFPNNNRVIHLPINREYFLDNWQQTIFARQRNNSYGNTPSLITGLIIVQEKILRQILQKTLSNNVSLSTTNNISVIHYPQGETKSILQGILPIKKQVGKILA